MDKIEKIRQEIERYIKHYEKLERNDFQNGELYICQELLFFLDTLSEEPDKSMEEEIKRYIPRDQCPVPDFMEAVARHFAEWGAEWQKQRMLKDAVEGVVTNANGVFGYDIAVFRFDDNHTYSVLLPHEEKRKYGDKVRIVVLKEKALINSM